MKKLKTLFFLVLMTSIYINAWAQPDISIDPSSYDETLAQGDSVIYNFTITNN